MIFFRVICAACFAAAIGWILIQPAGAYIRQEAPIMLYVGWPCAAFVGFFLLAKRQGAGIINGILNGFWTGIVSVVLAGFVYLVIKCSNPVMHGMVSDFRDFVRIAYYAAKPLFESMKNMQLLGLTMGLTTAIGAATEVLQWGLVYAKAKRAEDEEEPFIS